jgi:mannose-6-phosphate isomerase-like protein (cupin superfamily)
MSVYELTPPNVPPDSAPPRPEQPLPVEFLTVQDGVKVIYSEDTSPTCGVRVVHPSNPRTASANLGISVLYVPPGGSMSLHEHLAEETYIILSGSGEMLTVDGSRPVSVGDYIYLPPWARHGIVNTGREMLTVLLALTPPNP